MDRSCWRSCRVERGGDGDVVLGAASAADRHLAVAVAAGQIHCWHRHAAVDMNRRSAAVAVKRADDEVVIVIVVVVVSIAAEVAAGTGRGRCGRVAGLAGVVIVDVVTLVVAGVAVADAAAAADAGAGCLVGNPSLLPPARGSAGRSWMGPWLADIYRPRFGISSRMAGRTN